MRSSVHVHRLPPGVEHYVCSDREYLTPCGGIRNAHPLPRFEVLGSPHFVRAAACAAAELVAVEEVAYVEIRPGRSSDPWLLLVHPCPGSDRTAIWRRLHAAGVRRQRWLMPGDGEDPDTYGILVGPASGPRLEVALALLRDEHRCDRILFLARGSGPDESTRARLRRRAELVVERCDANEPDHALEQLETHALTVRPEPPARIVERGETRRPCIVAASDPLGLFAALYDGPGLDPFGSATIAPRFLSPGPLDVHGLAMVVDPSNHRVVWREIGP